MYPGCCIPSSSKLNVCSKATASHCKHAHRQCSACSKAAASGAISGPRSAGDVEVFAPMCSRTRSTHGLCAAMKRANRGSASLTSIHSAASLLRPACGVRGWGQGPEIGGWVLGVRGLGLGLRLGSGSGSNGRRGSSVPRKLDEYKMAARVYRLRYTRHIPSTRLQRQLGA